MILDIPERFYPGFKSLLSLSDTSMQQLIAALRDVTPSLKLPEYVKQIAAYTPQISLSELSEIIRTIFSLYSPLDSGTLTIEQFVEGLIDTIKVTNDLIPPKNWNGNKFAEQLKSILTSNEKIGVLAKAAGILNDHERTYRNARVLSDIRPIFGADVKSKPSASVLVHMLKITYYQDDNFQEFFVALDTNDLRDLRETLERAEAKATVLKELVAHADLDCIL